VGLSLFFSNGSSAPEVLVGDAPRLVQEIDLVEAVPSLTDDGIQPLLEASRTSALNWNGIEQVEDIWGPSLDGTLTRERYYRGAHWMEQPSVFVLSALSEGGTPLGKPWVIHAGRDDRMRPNDDAFVRRLGAPERLRLPEHRRL